jgi:serine/threonine protein kinase
MKIKIIIGILNVVVELCPIGNLESYLRQNRYTFISQFNVQGILDPRWNLKHFMAFCQSMHEMNFSAGRENSNAIRTSDLLLWAYQISDGMEYLGSRNVVHGDLACGFPNLNYIMNIMLIWILIWIFNYRRSKHTLNCRSQSQNKRLWYISIRLIHKLII